MQYHMMPDGSMMEGKSHGDKMLHKALKGKKFGKGKKGGKC